MQRFADILLELCNFMCQIKKEKLQFFYLSVVAKLSICICVVCLFLSCTVSVSTVETPSVNMKSHKILLRQELPLSWQAVWTGKMRQISMTSSKLGKCKLFVHLHNSISLCDTFENNCHLVSLWSSSAWKFLLVCG